MSVTIMGDCIPVKLLNKRANFPIHSPYGTLHNADANSDAGSFACSVPVDVYSVSGTDQTEREFVHSRSDSKKVDYALVLDANENTP